MTQPPNILCLVVDNLRADAFQAALERSRSEFARLVRERGVRFENCYAVASTTTPCFGSILTGLYPTRSGLRAHRGDKLGRDVVTLAQRLRDLGYRTAAHVTGPLGPETDLPRGFDRYDFRDRHETVYTSFGSRLRRHIRSNRDSSQPWFEFLHFWILHRTRRYSLLYRWLMRSEQGWLQDGLSGLDGLFSRLLQEQSAARTYERSLACMLFYLDLLLREVDLSRTAVLLLGDHGEHIEAPHDRYPAHDFFPKNRDHGFHVYEFLVRVPCVLLLPQHETGATVTGPCSQVDLAPTLVELAGGSGEFQGRSLLPCVQGARLVERPVFFEAVGGKQLQEDKLISGVRFEHWKFIQAPRSAAFPPELFDLQTDPHEATNLAAQRPEVVARARALLEAHYREKLSEEAQVRMSAAEEEIVTQRLKDLGYIE
jgi:arylsulfatase A-like enzyme